jgi:hypothetical protein
MRRRMTEREWLQTYEPEDRRWVETTMAVEKYLGIWCKEPWEIRPRKRAKLFRWLTRLQRYEGAKHSGVLAE